MGTSIQKVGSRVELIGDLDLLVALRLVLEEIRDNAAAYPSLQGMSSIWKESLQTAGPGTIDLKLERLESNSSGQTELSKLLSAVEEKLSSFGLTIPSQILNERYFVRGVRFADHETSRIRNAVQAIRRVMGM
jgi:hypothetical protein